MYINFQKVLKINRPVKNDIINLMKIAELIQTATKRN